MNYNRILLGSKILLLFLITIVVVFIILNSRYFHARYFQSCKEISLAGKSPILHLPQKFRLPPELAHLNCAQIVAGHNNETITEAAMKRVTYSDSPNITTDCESIRRRNYFPNDSLESDFPVAYARVVFQDYMFIESELAATFAPQNWYCYVIDAKASQEFHNRMKSLADCFPNVFLTNKEWEVHSSGHNKTIAQLECMKDLLAAERKWNYVIILENYDIALKTNEELVQIFKWFDGANDVAIKHLIPGRVNSTLDWTFEHLKIFKNESLYKTNATDPLHLEFAMSVAQNTLSRATVDFMVNKLDLAIMLQQYDTVKYGMDEGFIPTLMTTDALGLPGGFTHDCLDKGIEVKICMTRFTIWGDNMKKCGSGLSRHWICIFGVEDLSVNFKDSIYLFGNKVFPQLDYGAIGCWHEAMFNRTYIDRGTHRLTKEVYTQLPLVRYHADKKLNGKVDMDHFDCHYNISDKHIIERHNIDINNNFIS